MIVLVDLQREPATLSTLNGDLPDVRVAVTGGHRRVDVDAALRRAGAGRAPGHHAELAVNWISPRLSWSHLEAANDAAAPIPWSGWLAPSRLDQSRQWLAAPIIWGNPTGMTALPIVRGAVEHGEHRGLEMGIPTANVPLGELDVDGGVWAGWLYRSSGRRHLAVISAGHRSTSHGSAARQLLKAHLLDFSGDVYGEEVTVIPGIRIRPQRQSQDAATLHRQVEQDIGAVRRWDESVERWRQRSFGTARSAG